MHLDLLIEGFVLHMLGTWYEDCTYKGSESLACTLMNDYSRGVHMGLSKHGL